MDPERNPYAPGAGTPPPELSGRSAVLESAKIAMLRIAGGRPNKSFIFVGLRGVGKTVLLNRIDALAEDKGYERWFIEAREGSELPTLLVPRIRESLYRLDRAQTISTAVKRGLRVLRSFVGALRCKLGEVEVGLDVDPEEGTADSGDLESDLTSLLLAVGEAASSRKTAVAIMLDELQYLKPRDFGALIMAIHRAAQKSLPIVMFGAGLPQVVGLACRAKSYAERLFDFPEIGALREDDAKAAIQEPALRENVAFSDAALQSIVTITRGYPYFIQEWGYHSWNVAARSPIDQSIIELATPRAVQRLDGSFFRVRFDRLKPSEKRYLRAMADLGPGPHRSGDIAARYGAAVTSVGPVRSGLISQGMIYSPAHGENAFTVPLFDEFLRRAMPTFP